MILIAAQRWKLVGTHPVTGGGLYRLTARDDAAGDNNLTIPTGFSSMGFMVPLSLAGLGPFVAHGVSFEDPVPADLEWNHNPGMFGDTEDTIIADLIFNTPTGWSTNLTVSFWADAKATFF